MKKYYWFGFWIFFIAVSTTWWSYQNYTIKPIDKSGFSPAKSVLNSDRYPASNNNELDGQPDEMNMGPDKEGIFNGITLFYKRQSAKPQGFNVCQHFANADAEVVGKDVLEFSTTCEPHTLILTHEEKYLVACCDRGDLPAKVKSNNLHCQDINLNDNDAHGMEKYLTALRNFGNFCVPQTTVVKSDRRGNQTLCCVKAEDPLTGVRRY